MSGWVKDLRVLKFGGRSGRVRCSTYPGVFMVKGSALGSERALLTFRMLRGGVL